MSRELIHSYASRGREYVAQRMAIRPHELLLPASQNEVRLSDYQAVALGRRNNINKVLGEIAHQIIIGTFSDYVPICTTLLLSAIGITKAQSPQWFKPENLQADFIKPVGEGSIYNWGVKHGFERQLMNPRSQPFGAVRHMGNGETLVYDWLFAAYNKIPLIAAVVKRENLGEFIVPFLQVDSITPSLMELWVNDQMDTPKVQGVPKIIRRLYRRYLRPWIMENNIRIERKSPEQMSSLVFKYKIPGNTVSAKMDYLHNLSKGTIEKMNEELNPNFNSDSFGVNGTTFTVTGVSDDTTGTWVNIEPIQSTGGIIEQIRQANEGAQAQPVELIEAMRNLNRAAENPNVPDSPPIQWHEPVQYQRTEELRQRINHAIAEARASMMNAQGRDLTGEEMDTIIESIAPGWTRPSDRTELDAARLEEQRNRIRQQPFTPNEAISPEDVGRIRDQIIQEGLEETLRTLNETPMQPEPGIAQNLHRVYDENLLEELRNYNPTREEEPEEDLTDEEINEEVEQSEESEETEHVEDISEDEINAYRTGEEQTLETISSSDIDPEEARQIIQEMSQTLDPNVLRGGERPASVRVTPPQSGLQDVTDEDIADIIQPEEAPSTRRTRRTRRRN